MAQLSIFRAGRLEGAFHLPDKPVLIGRADGVDIQLLDSRVSRRHAVIRESVAGYIIQDLDTKNGTFVNEEAIERSLLFHSDAIVIGGYTLEFVDEAEAQAAPPRHEAEAELSGHGSRAPEYIQERDPSPWSEANTHGGEPSEWDDRLEHRRETARAPDDAGARVGRSVPFVEASAPVAPLQTRHPGLDSPSSEFDSGGGHDPVPTGNAQSPAGELPGETPGAFDVPVRADRLEIRETTRGVATIRHVPEAGTTTFGFSDRDHVRLRGTGVGTLFIVRRIDDEIEVRAGSSLRPLLLNGAPVVSAEAFPGDLFDVGGRSFEIGISLGEEAAPGAETVLGIDAVALEAAIHARLGDSVLVAERPPPPAILGLDSFGADSGTYEPLSESFEWEVDSVEEDAAEEPVVTSAAVAAAEEGPPLVMENIVIEAYAEGDVPVPLGANSGTMPRVSDTLRMRALGRSPRPRRAEQNASLPEPVQDTIDED